MWKRKANYETIEVQDPYQEYMQHPIGNILGGRSKKIKKRANDPTRMGQAITTRSEVNVYQGGFIPTEVQSDDERCIRRRVREGAQVVNEPVNNPEIGATPINNPSKSDGEAGLVEPKNKGKSKKRFARPAILVGNIERMIEEARHETKN